MATRLEGDRKLRRELILPGIAAPVIVTIAPEGLTFKVKGARLGVACDWLRSINACLTPSNCHPRFCGQPFEYLIYQSSKTKIKSRTKIKENVSQ